MPTHHQSSFIAALRKAGFNVVVHYYDTVSEDRRQLGWREYESLPAGERYVPQSASALSFCPDWRERVHILPGYARPFLLALALRLSLNGTAWLHWSEPSRSYSRSLAGSVVRKAYGLMVQRWALGALAIGEMARVDFQRWGISVDKIRYLPYSVAPLLPAQGTEAVESGARFLFLGALCHRKGIDVLLKAFAMVLKTHPDANLDLVGADQSEGEYQKLATSLHIDARVRFLPPVSAEDVAAPISGCHVLVLPSRFDGWGVVVNEAASLGKAVIATTACGVAHHLVSHGDSGFVVAPDDVDELARCMSEYCRDGMLAVRHGAESRRLFADVSPENNARRFSAALQALARDGIPT